MRSREEYVTWYQSDSDERESLKEEKKQSEVFSISGYMDNQAEGFPDIRQTWHGSEGAIYYLISEKGFAKLPTEKKTLYMELNVEKEKEPFIKAEIQNLLSRENQQVRSGLRGRVLCERQPPDSGKHQPHTLVCRSDELL